MIGPDAGLAQLIDGKIVQPVTPEEMACELRLMEAEEAEAERVSRRIEELYHRLHPDDHLRTIPGVGDHTAPVFLAAVANWTGVVHEAKQSSDVKGKGLRMTKAGPVMMKRALYQAGDIARQYDPQLAHLYHREMVHHGKTHLQAVGAVMSHLGARILTVLRENRPYELRDTLGKAISKDEARKLILSEYKVPEEIRRQRRRRNSKKPVSSKVKEINSEGRFGSPRTSEAAIAPQS